MGTHGRLPTAGRTGRGGEAPRRAAPPRGTATHGTRHDGGTTRHPPTCPEDVRAAARWDENARASGRAEESTKHKNTKISDQKNCGAALWD